MDGGDGQWRDLSPDNRVLGLVGWVFATEQEAGEIRLVLDGLRHEFAHDVRSYQRAGSRSLTAWVGNRARDIDVKQRDLGRRGSRSLARDGRRCCLS